MFVGIPPYIGNTPQELLEQIKQTQDQLYTEKENLGKKNAQLLKEKNKLSALARSTIKSPSMNYKKGVPDEFMSYYKKSAEKYGIDWYILSAIHSVETGYSSHPTMISLWVLTLA